MQFKISKCPKCGKFERMMISNNPICEPICFKCINDTFDYHSVQVGNMFCRTYNLPFKPELWLQLSETAGKNTFEQYALLFFEDKTIKNLLYDGTTSDVYAKIDKEWEKCRSFKDIITRIEPIKEAYMQKSRIRWGDGYNFYEYLSLDSSYSETLKSNNIANRLQKDAVKMLCRLNIEQQRALAARDTKAMKDLAAVAKTQADIADLGTMIAETKTDDIRSVAELIKLIEDLGFVFPYYQGGIKDEVDQALNDMKDTIRTLVLESTGLTATLEKMIKDRQNSLEQQAFDIATQSTSVKELMDFEPEDNQPDTEDDDLITNEDFS